MSIATDDRPSELQCRTVDRLAAAGLAVTQDSRARISTPEAEWLLIITSRQRVELVRWPEGDAPVDPYRLAELAAILLTGQPLADGVRPEPRPDDTVMALAGLTLRAAGFDVELNAFPDDVRFGICADIEVTDPRDTTGDATVLVSDGGILTWQRSYRHDDPETGADAIAGGILSALTHPNVGG